MKILYTFLLAFICVGLFAAETTEKEAVQIGSKSNADTQVQGKYWVTASSGKVHNSKCRFFKNSKGYLTDSPTGINCKICGGVSSKDVTEKADTDGKTNVESAGDGTKEESKTEERSTQDTKGRTILTGPRGGKYYINKNGGKTYIK